MATISTLNISVPEVSILGPLFLLIYNNDIENTSDRVSFVGFSDGTTAYSTDDHLNDSIADRHNQLFHILNWSTMNGLTLSVNKTQEMVFSDINTHP